MDTQTILILAVLVVFYIYYVFFKNRNLLKSEALEEMIKTGKGYILLDVRTPGEFSSGHIKSARNIPHDRIAGSLKKISKNKSVVVYCQSGSRAGAAARVLKSSGYSDVHNFGGIGRWKGKLI